MTECRQIDELLMGYLYQELDDARTAEVKAHVDVCHRCAGVVDGHQRTRQAARQLTREEPPAGLSARLLEEAARRAPAPQGRGVMAWLLDMFGPVSRHPALAAVASLVVVAGVAGFLTWRGVVDVRRVPVQAELRSAPSEGTAAPVPGAPARPQAPAPDVELLKNQAEPAQTEPERDLLRERMQLAQPEKARLAKDEVGTRSLRPMMKKSMESKEGRGAAALSDDKMRFATPPPASPAVAVDEEARYERVAEAPAPASAAAPAAAAAQEPESSRSKAKSSAPARSESREASPAPAARSMDASADSAAVGAPGAAKKDVSVDELYRRAKARALAGDCPGARELIRQIYQADRDYHAKRVANDRDLARCLSKKSSP